MGGDNPVLIEVSWDNGDGFASGVGRPKRVKRKVRDGLGSAKVAVVEEGLGTVHGR